MNTRRLLYRLQHTCASSGTCGACMAGNTRRGARHGGTISARFRDEDKGGEPVMQSNAPLCAQQGKTRRRGSGGWGVGAWGVKPGGARTSQPIRGPHRAFKGTVGSLLGVMSDFFHLEPTTFSFFLFFSFLPPQSVRSEGLRVKSVTVHMHWFAWLGN